MKQSIILCCDLPVVNRNVLFDFENGGRGYTNGGRARGQEKTKTEKTLKCSGAKDFSPHIPTPEKIDPKITIDLFSFQACGRSPDPVALDETQAVRLARWSVRKHHTLIETSQKSTGTETTAAPHH